MRYSLVLVLGCVLGATVAVIACRREPVRVPVEEKPMEATPPVEGAPGTLKARVVSWDVGSFPATEAPWVERVVAEGRDAHLGKVDVLVFLNCRRGVSGVRPDECHYEFVTRGCTRRCRPQ